MQTRRTPSVGVIYMGGCGGQSEPRRVGINITLYRGRQPGSTRPFTPHDLHIIMEITVAIQTGASGGGEERRRENLRRNRGS